MTKKNSFVITYEITEKKFQQHICSYSDLQQMQVAY